ncbi:MAG: DUF2378 family protein [Candidatus Devosia euplotis]|nr:DUF2378 family protein [Candidatus Devosia euplotis]
MEEPKCSGAILLDQFLFLRESYGDEPLQAALGSLSEEDAEIIQGLQAISWCEVGVAKRYKDAVAAHVGLDSLQLQRSVVRAGVNKTFKGVWRFIVKHLVSDEQLAKRLPLLYTKTFDRGEPRVERLGDGKAELVVADWPQIPDYDLLGLQEGVEAVFEAAGRQRPRVTSERKATQVLIRVNWK